MTTLTRALPWSRPVLITLIGLLCASCDQYWRDSGIWDIGEHRGVLLDISNYYHRHAKEENGRCISPYIDGVTEAAVNDVSDDLIDVYLRYRYRDFLNDGDDDCDPKRRPLRCTIMRECHGYAARDFRIEITESGYDVIDMSGSRRR